MYTQLSEALLAAAIDRLPPVSIEHAVYASYGHDRSGEDGYGAPRGKKRHRQSLRKRFHDHVLPAFLEARPNVIKGEFLAYYQPRLHRGLAARAHPTSEPLNVDGVLAALGPHLMQARPNTELEFLIDKDSSRDRDGYAPTESEWYFTAASILTARFFYEANAWPPAVSTWRELNSVPGDPVLAARFARPSGQHVLVAALGALRSGWGLPKSTQAVMRLYQHAMDLGDEFELHAPRCADLLWTDSLRDYDYDFMAYRREERVLKRLKIPWYISREEYYAEDLVDRCDDSPR